MKRIILLLTIVSLGFSCMLFARSGKRVSGNCINGKGTMEYDIPNTSYTGQWKDGKNVEGREDPYETF